MDRWSKRRWRSSLYGASTSHCFRRVSLRSFSFSVRRDALRSAVAHRCPKDILFRTIFNSVIVVAIPSGRFESTRAVHEIDFYLLRPLCFFDLCFFGPSYYHVLILILIMNVDVLPTKWGPRDAFREAALCPEVSLHASFFKDIRFIFCDSL